MLLAIAVDSASAPATAPAIASIAGAWSLPAGTTAWLSMSFDIAYLTAIVVSVRAIAGLGKRTYLGWSLFAFAAAALACAAAPNAAVLITARIAEGAALGAFFTSGLLTIVATAPRSDLGLAMTLFAAVQLLVPTLAPLFAGLLLDHGTWRLIFAGLALPALLAAYLCRRYLKDVTAAEPQPVDLSSFGSLLFAFASFAFLTAQGAAVHWFARPTTSVAFGAGAVALAIYATRELRLSRAPFVELRVLAMPVTARGLAVAACLGSLLAATALEAQFVRAAFHLGPTTTGVFLASRCLGICGGLVIVTAAATAPPARLMWLGLVVVAATFVAQGLAVAGSAPLGAHAAIGILQAGAFAVILGPLATVLFATIARTAFASLAVFFKVSVLTGGALGLAAAATELAGGGPGRSVLPSYVALWYVAAALSACTALLAATLRPSAGGVPVPGAARAEAA